MTWNDHTHPEYAEERHDHDGDYAPLHHRHYDLETDDKTAQQAITCLRVEVDELRRQLEEALGRITILEGTSTRLADALREAADRHEDTLRAGMAGEVNLTVAAELAEAFTVLSGALAGPELPEEEPEPEPCDPGPEVDDEGGMSEYRYTLPEDYQRGQS